MPTKIVKGMVVNMQQASELVYNMTRIARASGCIPIAAAVLRPKRKKGLFRLEGIGHNQLAWFRPFVHGETGAFEHAGVIDYRGTRLLSSLSPCEFCQGCAAHLGIQDVDYLDDLNFSPDQGSFDKFGVRHQALRHRACCRHFADWLKQDTAMDGPNLWGQDIGTYNADSSIEVELHRLVPAMSLVLGLMQRASEFGEYPCASVVLDSKDYRVLGSAPGRILENNDPIAIPEIVAGRQCAARTRWDRTIFVSSQPPSPIAVGMMRRWRVQNVVVLNNTPIGVRPDWERMPDTCFTYPNRKWSNSVGDILRKWTRHWPLSHRERVLPMYAGAAKM